MPPPARRGASKVWCVLYETGGSLRYYRQLLAHVQRRVIGLRPQLGPACFDSLGSGGKRRRQLEVQHVPERQSQTALFAVNRTVTPSAAEAKEGGSWRYNM